MSDYFLHCGECGESEPLVTVDVNDLVDDIETASEADFDNADEWAGLYERHAFTRYGLELRGWVAPIPMGDIDDINESINRECSECGGELALAEADAKQAMREAA